MLIANMLSPNFADWLVKNAMLIISKKLRIIRSVLTLKKRFILAKSNSISLYYGGVGKYYYDEIEADTENGIRVYEISFETSTKEYEYTINAKTGKIINREVENVEEDD